ncbi:MAG: hypothetical protein HC798_02990 [Polaribacter sp.]|nr:hypothetical protein [Polaribacter sp.]
MQYKEILKGLIPFLLSVLLCGFLNYVLWKLLIIIHHGYQDILHGFTYNGYYYIFAFSFLNIWLCYQCYQCFTKELKPINLIIVPVFIWLIINGLIVFYLQGAGFFIIPVFIALIVLVIAVFTNFEYRTQKNIFHHFKYSNHLHFCTNGKNVSCWFRFKKYLD